MALLLADSCRVASSNTGYYAQAGLAATSNGRFGASSYYYYTNGYANLVTAPLRSLTDRLIFGFASYGGPGSAGVYQSTPSAPGMAAVMFTGSPGGLMSAWYGNYNLLGTSTAIVPAGWHYWEFDVYLAASGTITVRCDGGPFWTLSGVNTAAFQSSVNGVGWGAGNGAAEYWVADLYVCDTTGSYNNSFLGDIRVDTIYPDGAGLAADFSRGGSDSGTNWGQIDETGLSNGDTDYNYSSTVGHQDLVTFGSLATTSGTVKAVTHSLYARKADAGSRAIRGLVRPTTTTTYSSSSDRYLGLSYGYLHDILETNPDDSQPWEIADVNGAQFGYELTV